jgi:hypothetical protein
MMFGTQIDEDDDSWINNVLVIINVRLGMEKVAEEYFDSIISCTKIP